MLAQSAARAGWRSWVLDGYGDQDTQACSERCQVVTNSHGGFDRDRVLAELRFAAAEGAVGLVYGSGLECVADLVAEASALLPLWGNEANTLRWLKSPRRFFALLDSLDIAYPQTDFAPPVSPGGWLVKPGCGEGGKGVAFYAAAREGAYFQRQIVGTPMSALFLADGCRACVLGFNELWAGGVAERPYGFVGASNRPTLARPWRERLTDWVQQLVGRVGLKGLNSLDFIFDGRCCRVLEINPRPSATLALYDGDFPDGLLAAHVRACGGRLPEAVPAAPPRVLRTVFAPRRLMVPAGVVWPSWCADLPLARSVVEAGQPLCSVSACGAGQDLMRLSLEREQAALSLCRPL